jgi:ATP-dependent DNA helicase RecQ
MDIVRGKTTDRTAQYGHERISTFGLCADNTELQLRAVLRQLIATDALCVDAESFNTLHLTEGSRAVLKGEVPVLLRQSLKQVRSRKPSGVRLAKDDASQVLMDVASQARLLSLKAWRDLSR